MGLFSKYDLYARADFDGLVSAALIRQKVRVRSLCFVSAEEVSNRDLQLGSRPITLNLPWCDSVKWCYDHRPRSEKPVNRITRPGALSTSRVVWEHFGGARAFPKFSEELIAAADKFSSATYSREDVENPSGWELLSFLLDTQTGLSRLGQFSLSHSALLNDLVDLLPGKSAEEVLTHPDLAARARFYRAEQSDFREQVLSSSRMLPGSLLLIDYRMHEQTHVGNRYLAYALFPEALLSLTVTWGFMREQVVISMGRSIFAPAEEQKVDVGALMRTYGGGGHPGAGKCSVKSDDFERILGEIVDEVTSLNSAKDC